MDYLLKANAVVILFYLCYKLFLQKETFFEPNRYFLLAGLAFASIIPLIVIPIHIAVVPQVNSINFTPIANLTTTNIEESFNYFQLFEWVYLIGITIFFIKFLIELTGLTLVLLQNKKEKKGNYTYIETQKDNSPFSFFKYIVYNPNHFSVEELEHIILHEKVHAKQYHSIDILITKIASILFWFNPFIWLYNKSLQQNLEFIADNKTQKKIRDTKSYQTLLLKTVLYPQQMTLVNNFYNSLIKKRIIMLHKSKSKQLNLWKYALILPLLVLFLMSFNTKEVYTTATALSKTSNASSIIKTIENIEAVIITKDFSKQDFEKVKRQFSKLNVQLKFKGIKRNSAGEIIAIKAAFKTPEDSKGNYNVSGQKPINAFKFYYNYSNGDVGFNKTEEHTFVVKGEPNENVFIYSTDEDDNDNEKIEVFVKNKINQHSKIKGKTEDRVIIKGKKNNKNVIIENEEDKNVIIDLKNIDEYTIINSDNISNPTVIINEKKTALKELHHIDPDKIANINIIKADHNTNIYGTKDDVIIVTTKNDSDNSNLEKTEVIFHNKTHALEMDNYLYILDGKEISKSELEKIYSKNTVSSLKLLKGEDAIKKYGEKGKNGVIIIKTK